MMVRPEEERDVAAIDAVTRAAFADHPHSDQTEPLIIARLRDTGALRLSLVAEDEGAVVGHIGFSPVRISDGSPSWLGLGPLAVRPDRQRHGIGGALVRAGLEQLRRDGARGCVVMGDPEYYRRFGFANEAGLQLADCAPQYFLGLALSGPMASGMVRYHWGFYGSAAEITNGE